jgi:serine/threonine-protein kinase
MSTSNLVGQILAERYRVDRFIGAGGMSVVYRVWDLKRQVPLAMKVLRAEFADDPSIFKRFVREANALRKLTHPNIVPFYDVFNWQDSAVLIEHYIDGFSLKSLLKRRGSLSIEEALVYLKAICAALGFTHAHGVIHCDVKPDNILIDQGGDIYLTDFGIARHAESTATTVGLAGTAAYMAPEQIRIEPVTAETDIYSLGVMLYEMLAGKRPFKGSSAELESSASSPSDRMRYAHLNLDPTDPREINPDITEQMAQVILKALAKDPADRYPSTTEFLKSVAKAAGIDVADIPDRAPVQRNYLAPPLAQDVSTPSPRRRTVVTVPPRPKLIVKRWHLIAGGAGVILLLAAGFAVTRSGLLADTDSESTTLQEAGSDNQELAGPEPTEDASVSLTPDATSVFGNGDWTPRIDEVGETLMAFVPAGCFVMGLDTGGAQEAPAHRQCIERPFWIDVTEVSNEAYGSAGASVGGDFPRDSVDWFEAQAYCGSRGGRLPTEAEWEYAARGPDGLLFPWGNNLEGDRLNHCDVNCNNPRADRTANDRYATAAPGGSYPEGASWVGALDMSGNLWEWVLNPYTSYPLDLSSLPPVNNESLAVVRGGSWESYDLYLRATTRFRHYPLHKSAVIGFRCMRESED